MKKLIITLAATLIAQTAADALGTLVACGETCQKMYKGIDEAMRTEDWNQFRWWLNVAMANAQYVEAEADGYVSIIVRYQPVTNDCVVNRSTGVEYEKLSRSILYYNPSLYASRVLVREGREPAFMVEHNGMEHLFTPFVEKLANGDTFYGFVLTPNVAIAQ